MRYAITRAAVCVLAATAAITGTAVTAQGAKAVHIDVDEVFTEGGVSTFTSTIDGCASGTVATGGRVTGGPRFGKFTGFKFFDCAGGGGFIVRLSASFDDTGSTGTWAIVRSEDLGGLHGAGTLAGSPTPTGINDVYDGVLRP